MYHSSYIVVQDKTSWIACSAVNPGGQLEYLADPLQCDLGHGFVELHPRAAGFVSPRATSELLGDCLISQNSRRQQTH